MSAAPSFAYFSVTSPGSANSAASDMSDHSIENARPSNVHVTPAIPEHKLPSQPTSVQHSVRASTDVTNTTTADYDDRKFSANLWQQAQPNTPHQAQSNSALIRPSDAKSRRSKSTIPRHQLADYELGRTLGAGAYGKVVRGTKISDQQQYAIKICNKMFITKQNKQETIMKEKRVLTLLDGHTNIIRLHATFQDTESLYFVMELAAGGELYEEIRSVGRYPLDVIQFYTAELVIALEYMHRHHIVHRDIKPENILIGKNRHLKVIDFGSCKILDDDDNESDNGQADDDDVAQNAQTVDADLRSNVAVSKPPTKKRRDSFVGTAEYVSPEVLEDKPITHAADLWALGAVIYHMAVGRPPFRGASEYLTFRQILAREIEWPEHVNPLVRDLVDRLLQLEPEKRIGMGAQGYDEIKTHPLFAGLNWFMIPMTNGPAQPLRQCESQMPARQTEPKLQVEQHALPTNSKQAAQPTTTHPPAAAASTTTPATQPAPATSGYDSESSDDNSDISLSATPMHDGLMSPPDNQQPPVVLQDQKLQYPNQNKLISKVSPKANSSAFSPTSAATSATKPSSPLTQPTVAHPAAVPQPQQNQAAPTSEPIRPTINTSSAATHSAPKPTSAAAAASKPAHASHTSKQHATLDQMNEAFDDWNFSSPNPAQQARSDTNASAPLSDAQLSVATSSSPVTLPPPPARPDAAPATSKPAEPRTSTKAAAVNNANVIPSDKAKTLPSQWQRFLLPGEEIVFMSLVQKRRGFYAKKRQLIMTSLPRFVYIDPEKMQFKKQIEWHDQLTAEQIDDQAFWIRTPDREYYMKGLSSSAHTWIDKINEVQDRRLRQKLDAQLHEASKSVKANESRVYSQDC